MARYFYFYKLTRPGKVLVASMFMSMPMALLNLDIPVYQLFLAIFFLMLCTFFAGIFNRPRMGVTETCMEKISAGEILTQNLALRNLDKKDARDISVRYYGTAPSIERLHNIDSIAFLEPEKSVTLDAEFRAHRRGRYTLPSPVVFTEFPFSIWRSGVKLNQPMEEHTFLVLPRFHAADGINVPTTTRHQPGGIAFTSHVGESPEYIGSREYRPGDSIRRIDFRSWARIRKPVVREYHEEYYCRIALVLDTFIEPKRKQSKTGYPELEAAISLSATIADALSNGEYIIDIFAAGPDLYVFRSGRHTAHFENVLEILACLEARRDNPFDYVGPALLEEMSKISTTIFVFIGWDDSREQIVRAALEAGSQVKVFFVAADKQSIPLSLIEQVCGPVSLFSPEDVQRGSFGIL
jgi:uncharacterized protein (DUF58 family)